MGGQEIVVDRNASPHALASRLSPSILDRAAAPAEDPSIALVPVSRNGGQHQDPPRAPKVQALSTVPKLAVLEIPRKHLGIKIRYPTKAEDLEDLEVDIVAVHGIGANPEATWTYTHRDPKDKSKVLREVNWLSDENMLPHIFSKARIMTFGYDSVWYGKAPPKQSLKGIATKVLMDLKKQRKGCSDRPIIFIGHCFGGLVIEQAYLSAKIHAVDYPGIYHSITGMIFLGTPHRGSEMMSAADSTTSSSLGDFYKLIASQHLAVQDDLLKTIAQDNATLVDTVHEFTRDVGTRTPSPPKLFCFFEERPTAVGRIAGLRDDATRPREFMVNEASGSLHGHEKCGMTLDHFEMNKFEDEEDKYFSDVAEQIQNMVDASAEMMKERGASTHNLVPHPTHLNAHGQKKKVVPMLPYPVAKGFAARNDVLAKLKANFEHSSRVCLVGPCGAGKTHVAVEYADGFFKENPNAKIYWVNASNAAEFELSYLVINRDLKLKVGKKSGQLMAAIRDFLKQDDSGNWLMIFDGLEQNDNSSAQPDVLESTAKSLMEYIPTGHPYGGRVLVTTRTKSLATRVVNHKYVVEVPAQLSKEDASQLLFGGEPTKALSSSSTKFAAKIADTLGNSAGALALVFAYMSTPGSRVTWKELFEHVHEAAAHKASIGTGTPQELAHVKCMNGIWDPLYGKLKQNHADAARLLQMLCLLDVQSMPLLLLNQHFQKDPSQRDKQVKVLTAFDTLELSVNGRDVRVTPMIRFCVLRMLNENEEETLFLAEAVLELVCEAYPSASAEDTIKCRVLMPCAMAALRLSVRSSQAHRNQACLLFKTAAHDHREERYDRATTTLEECVKLCKAHKGEPKDLEVEATELLSQTKKAQRRSERQMSKMMVEAEGLQKPSEKIAPVKKTSKPETVRSTSKAAVASHRQDEDSMKNNIKHFQQILDWCQAKYGADHLDTGRQQYNLALAYDAHGQHDKAEKLYQDAIATMKRIFGSGQENAEALRIQGGLARMYCEQERFDEAETTFKEVVKGQQEVLGFDHPETLVTRLNTALVGQELRPDDRASAAKVIQQVLSAQTRLLGSEDAATLRTACSLALNHRLNGCVEDAESLYQMVLRVQRRTLGDKHPDTRKTVRMLAELQGGGGGGGDGVGAVVG